MIILVENERRLQDLVDVPEMAWQIIDLSENQSLSFYENPKIFQRNFSRRRKHGIRLVKMILQKIDF